MVLLTWSLFQRRFAGDPSIIGKQIHLDTIPTTVVGVLPSWFTYPDARIQFWMPYAQTFSPGDYGMHDGHQSMVVARLKPGVSAEAATREVSALQYRIHLANASKPVAEDVWSRPMIDDLVKECANASAGAAGCGRLHAADRLPQPLQPAGSAVGRASQGGCHPWRAGRQPACSNSRADDGEPADLPGRRRTRPAAVARFDLLARGTLAQSASCRLRACRWMGSHVCAGSGSRDGTAGWPRAGDFFHRQRAAFGAAGVLAIGRRQRLAGAAAQDDAYSRNRADGHAADLGRAAFQELPAPAHGRSRAAASIT